MLKKTNFVKRSDENILTQVRFEPGTSGMWSKRANCYTTKTLMIFFSKVFEVFVQCENFLAGNSNHLNLSNSSTHYQRLIGQKNILTLFWSVLIHDELTWLQKTLSAIVHLPLPNMLSNPKVHRTTWWWDNFV